MFGFGTDKQVESESELLCASSAQFTSIALRTFEEAKIRRIEMPAPNGGLMFFAETMAFTTAVIHFGYSITTRKKLPTDKILARFHTHFVSEMGKTSAAKLGVSHQQFMTFYMDRFMARYEKDYVPILTRFARREPAAAGDLFAFFAGVTNHELSPLDRLATAEAAKHLSLKVWMTWNIIRENTKNL